MNPILFYEYGKWSCKLIDFVVDNLDTDALAFISATGITDSTQKDSIFYLVSALKQNNIWIKLNVIYPFVGGTATTHKFNLKDPRDMDVAFRLIFNGTWTHSLTGVTPGNNASSYADTKFSPTVNLTIDNCSISTYIRTNPIGKTYRIDIGAINVSRTDRFYMNIHSNDGSCYYDIKNRLVISNHINGAIGLHTMSRLSLSLLKAYRNGRLFGSSISSTSTYLFPSDNITLGGTPNEVNSYSNREQSFASIGASLTDLDSCRLYKIVQQFQIILGRSV